MKDKGKSSFQLRALMFARDPISISDLFVFGGIVFKKDVADEKREKSKAKIIHNDAFKIGVLSRIKTVAQ